MSQKHPKLHLTQSEYHTGLLKFTTYLLKENTQISQKDTRDSIFEVSFTLLNRLIWILISHMLLWLTVYLA